MRLLWLSDVHLNHCQSAADLLHQINDENPQYIVITGDVSDGLNLRKHLEDLSAHIKCPIYFVLGNHDFYLGSIGESRHIANTVSSQHDNLIYLTMSNPVELSPTVALVGHDGLADGGYGLPESFPINDYQYIADFSKVSDEQKKKLLAHCGRESSSSIWKKLPSIASQYRQIYIAVHVPPFQEACLYQGEPSEPEYLPHFSNKSVGDMLKLMAWLYPDVNFTVLCGHTHESTHCKIQKNLDVYVAEATYGLPEIQRIFEVK